MPERHTLIPSEYFAGNRFAVIFQGFVRLRTITSVTCIPLPCALTLIPDFQERLSSTAATTKREDRNASARAFIHSLNILVKYVRLYGFQHKRTEGQFEITWKELQQGLPKDNDGTFLLGVSENRLLLDGVPLDPGQAER